MLGGVEPTLVRHAGVAVGKENKFHLFSLAATTAESFALAKLYPLASAFLLLQTAERVTVVTII